MRNWMKIVKNLKKNVWKVFKIDFESTNKCILLHEYSRCEMLWQCKYGPFVFFFFFFLIYTETRFVSWVWINKIIMKTSALLIHVKYIIVHYSNLNFQNLFQHEVYYRLLGSQTLWYLNGGPLNIMAKSEKKVFSLTSKIGIFCHNSWKFI